jgi:hypothetical protein
VCREGFASRFNGGFVKRSLKKGSVAAITVSRQKRHRPSSFAPPTMIAAPAYRNSRGEIFHEFVIAAE